MTNKLFFSLILIITLISCKKYEIKKPLDNSLIFHNKNFSITIKKDSMSFDKIGDKLEIVSNLKKAYFTVDKIQDIVILDTVNGVITIKISSKKHNTKTFNQTLLVLKTKKNEYYSLSTYTEYRPIGYKDTIGATLNKEKEMINISLTFSNYITDYKFILSDNLNNVVNKLNNDVANKFHIKNFFYFDKGFIFDKTNSLDREIVVK